MDGGAFRALSQHMVCLKDRMKHTNAVLFKKYTVDVDDPRHGHRICVGLYELHCSHLYNPLSEVPEYRLFSRESGVVLRRCHVFGYLSR